MFAQDVRLSWSRPTFLFVPTIRLTNHRIGGTKASTAAITSNTNPPKIHSTSIQSVSPILSSSSGGILFIAYLTPKTQVLIEAAKKSSEAPSNVRDAFLIRASGNNNIHRRHQVPISYDTLLQVRSGAVTIALLRTYFMEEQLDASSSDERR